MIILDVEIKKAIPPRRDEPVHPDIEYCEGWRDFKGMGVACVCTFDLRTGLSRVFLEGDLQDLQGYVSGAITGGFNTRRFDLPLLEANGVPTGGGEHYDMLESIWLALGLDPNHFEYRTHGGWSLDNVCAQTLNDKKSGSGALAPIWWQRGQRGRVIDYCLRDVWLEGRLMRHIVQHGYVERSGMPRLQLPVPEAVRQACELAW